MAESRATRTNLDGAAAAWREAPEVMDFLDPESPVHALKMLERDLYLSRWAPFFPPGARVLDLGGGIGRFSRWCLEQGNRVELVDADSRSVAAARRHCAPFGDRFHAHVARAESFPALGSFDVVIACELLCYVDDPAAVLARARESLRPGGTLLASVEAPYGWAMAVDAPPGFADALLGSGVVAVPGDRFVRTYSPASLRALLGGWQVVALYGSHYVLSGPFERVAGEVALAAVLELEERFRQHPVLGELGRAVVVIAQ